MTEDKDIGESGKNALFSLGFKIEDVDGAFACFKMRPVGRGTIVDLTEYLKRKLEEDGYDGLLAVGMHGIPLDVIGDNDPDYPYADTLGGLDEYAPAYQWSDGTWRREKEPELEAAKCKCGCGMVKLTEIFGRWHVMCAKNLIGPACWRGPECHTKEEAIEEWNKVMQTEGTCRNGNDCEPDDE